MIKSKKPARWIQIVALFIVVMLSCMVVPTSTFAEETNQESENSESLSSRGGIAEEPAVDEIVVMYENMASYEKSTFDPTELGYGYEWIVFGLARWGTIEDDQKARYLENLSAYLKEADAQFGSHSNTEYARIALALTSLGVDATDFEGYNLLAPLAEFEDTIVQGINGAIYALLAFDSGGYEVPELSRSSDYTQATRERYVEYILSLEVEGGGWSFTAGATSADSDITAMTLQALNAYRGGGFPGVDEAVTRALEVLSSMQNADGGFGYGGITSAESSAQVIIAMNVLLLELTDERFVKNGNTVFDAFTSCYDNKSGAISHEPGGDANVMATYQGIYMLNSLYRDLTDDRPLFDMTDLELTVYGSSPVNQAGVTEGQRNTGDSFPLVVVVVVTIVAALGVVAYFIARHYRRTRS